jgi:hypothetical protein
VGSGGEILGCYPRGGQYPGVYPGGPSMVVFLVQSAVSTPTYREAGITWFRMSRNYMVSEKWSSWEVVVFPSDHF